MTTNAHRLDNVVTRCSSPTNSGPLNLAPNGLTESTLLGEHTTRVSEGYRGEYQRTSQYLHDVQDVVTSGRR